MHMLPGTLRSLEFLRYPDLEVIVVDGPSSDGTLFYLQTHWHDKIKIYTCNEANLSKSRNVGVKHASGDIVCFTDDDGIPEPDWLDKLVIAYEDPQVGAVGGWVRNHTGVDFQTKYIVSNRDSTSEVLIENATLVPASKKHADKFPGLIGVNSSFRKSVLLEVGGFDEEYAYFLDETDVSLRVVDAGYLVKMLPEAEVHHKYALSHIRFQNGIPRSLFQTTNSIAYYIIKNALADTKLSWCMERIAKHKQDLIAEANRFLSEKMIDQAHHARLLLEIEEGMAKGIFDAFNPRRCLLQIDAEHRVDWKPFPRQIESKNRLRIAFVTGLYPPRVCGGVAVFIHNLAKQLASLGHEVTVITQSDEGLRHTVDFEESIWVHRVPVDYAFNYDLPLSMPNIPDYFKETAGRFLAELDRVNCRRKFHLVVGALWNVEMAAIIASKKYSTAMYLVTSYKLMENDPAWKKNKKLYGAYVPKMIEAEAWTLQNVDHVLASTKAILNDVEAAYGFKIARSKVNILPFGVPKPSTICGAQSSLEIVILFVGRFEQRKGIDLILEIMPDILMRNHNVRFICIGDHSKTTSSENSELRQFQEIQSKKGWINRVQFLGHVDGATLEKAYACCDIFIAPSRYESFGLIYLEAMRFGKACIGTTAGGIPEIVVNEETGLLIPPNDANALRLAVQRLIVDRPLRLRLGNAGKKRYEERFTVELFADKFISLVKDKLFTSFSKCTLKNNCELESKLISQHV